MSGTSNARITSGLLTAEVMAYGAALSDLRLDGVAHGLTLSLPSLGAYQADKAHIGAIAGPVAGRIAGGRFTIDGSESRTTMNEGANTLHGGARGFGRRMWTMTERGPDFVQMSLVWEDGAEGFPGPLRATCRYHVAGRALTITLEAEADRPTLCNMAQHSYFNLGGGGRIDDHHLEIASGEITPFGPDLTPTGAVADAPDELDFRTPRRIADTMLDTHYVLAPDRRAPAFAARLATESVAMTLRTTEPGLVVYTADNLATPPFGPRAGLCLEPQCWPDAINQPTFPSIVLRPGERYRQETILEFALL